MTIRSHMPPFIQFLGAAGTVTGSKFLFQTKDFKALIDCGLFQGLKELRILNREKLPVTPSSIDCVILTHAHLDHCGYLPLLVKNGFKGKIYCTTPTRELAKIILMDSARIQEEDAEYANKMGFSKHSPAEPLYTTLDAQKALKLFTIADINQWIKISKEIKIRFSNSGHIIGSAFIELNHNGKKTVFSGDLGRTKPMMLQKRAMITKADYLVVESTYGDRLHTKDRPLEILERIINETVKRKGHLIIPSFAVGRAQELIYLINKLKKQKRIPQIPVFLDSPMAIHATEIFLSNPNWHTLSAKEVRDFLENTSLVKNQQQSQELSRSKHSTIVIAGSGMVTGGRVLHHLEKRLSDPRNTVLLAGYQAPGTRGRLLADSAPEIKMFGTYIPVKARIETISSLSAHADQGEILSWLKGFKTPPKKTFIVHGELQAANALRIKIQDTLNWFAEVPTALSIKNLD